ncbi:cysteine desulfurase family protein [Smaragdicoccus niigatensis]|uniref:cysteine desulfurase family protein n=1 Tax=Smaragdicoccus niigatensis TaxID=359359 RepID=UPI00036CCA21|nr:cysteine desulfurase family protein [Smaragdicoccus niigatensis]
MTVYLDHAATTAMVPAAIEAMNSIFLQVGNPSSLHASGRAARRTIEESRESIAECVGARPSEILFTSGGTESDNLAVKGIFWARREVDSRGTRIITSAVEHHAVLDAVEWLEKREGAAVTWLPVDGTGAVSVTDFRAALEEFGDEVALATVMWANNEVGTLMPITELAAVAAEYRVPLHSDAVQAVGAVPVDFASSGLAALSFSAHKFGGPRGTGALLLGRDVAAVPLVHGGGHERDLRGGTLDTASIAAMAAALREMTADLGTRSAELATLRDYLITEVRSAVPDAILNGPDGERLPGNAHFTFPGCEGESMLMLLDAAGIECSTGSACTSGVATPSHVLMAMGMGRAAARGSLRFSLGHTSTKEDVDVLVAALPAVVERAKAAGLMSVGSMR